jgi:hypothetical protein
MSLILSYALDSSEYRSLLWVFQVSGWFLSIYSSLRLDRVENLLRCSDLMFPFCRICGKLLPRLVERGRLRGFRLKHAQGRIGLKREVLCCQPPSGGFFLP